MQNKKKLLAKTTGILAVVAALTLALVFTACSKPSRSQSSSGSTTTRTSSGGDAAQAQSSSGSDTAAKSNSVNWEKALNDYEAFVDEYVAFMKEFKANPSDMALLGKSTSMLQQAQQAADSVSKVQDGLSGGDLGEFNERYTKLLAKMTAAMQ